MIPRLEGGRFSRRCSAEKQSLVGKDVEVCWLANREFVVIDFEAVTPVGRSPIPIELAAVSFTSGSVAPPIVLVDQLIRLDDVSLLLPFDVQQTGITADMLAWAPDAREVLEALAMRVRPGATIVAHNAAFERSVLRGVDGCPPSLSDASLADTLRLSRKLRPANRSHSLDALAREFAIAVPSNRHRALADALPTCRVLQRLFDVVKSDSSIRSWHELIGIMRLPARAQRATQIIEQRSLFD